MWPISALGQRVSESAKHSRKRDIIEHIFTQYCYKKVDKKIFLLAQSYMPAQDIHILRNPDDEDLSPWYSVDFGEKLHTPEWIFTKKELCRF